MNKRIIGFDLARAFAIFGMVIVNFKVAMNANEGNSYLLWFSSLFEGKSSALFVILAGIGITLLSKKNVSLGEKTLILKSRFSIIKRGILLVIIGLSYSVIWEADILHLYGFYFFIAAFFITSKNCTIFIATIIIVVTFPILMMFFDYDKGWNWSTFHYSDFWSLNGAFRRIFFNGFHPVFPWLAFILYGMWLGRQDLTSTVVQKKITLISIFIVVTIEASLFWLRQNTEMFSDLDIAHNDLMLLLSTSITPPLPTFMLAAASTSTIVVVLCIIISNLFRQSKLISWLCKTGQMSLTLYVAHVVVGIWLIEIVFGLKKHTIEFSLFYTIVFCVISVVFSVFWINRNQAGPLELLFKKLIKTH